MRDIQVSVRGNAVADPMDRRQDDSTPSASVRIAVTGRYYHPVNNEFTDRKTEFISVFARRSLARNLLSSVHKGQPLIVTGRLHSSEWVGEDETPRHTLTIQAESIGHDLNYGSSTFVKPLREADLPNLDPQTGEIDPPDPIADHDADVAEAEDTAEEDTASTSALPAPF